MEQIRRPGSEMDFLKNDIRIRIPTNIRKKHEVDSTILKENSPNLFCRKECHLIDEVHFDKSHRKLFPAFYQALALLSYCKC
ncbi:hypothetical protein QTO34_004801 [Cnephaeus nilssonii]|uniref:Uncharacterized protein n=1 Tax=Cnephaeus nilssonii TaxID=3371016 RepID=A0AA40HQZ5_CNENI|nr:hypothetical protein QTO34_004801 [Eptesicus nilssonii]